MEYADGGTLQNYLKVQFSNLTWDDKFNLALQLACAVLCLHDEKIVHRDLVIYLHIVAVYTLFNNMVDVN